MITATRDSFQDMFDDDMTLEYEPSQTAAIILVGGDEEAEKAALEVRPSAFLRALHSSVSDTASAPASRAELSMTTHAGVQRSGHHRGCDRERGCQDRVLDDGDKHVD